MKVSFVKAFYSGACDGRGGRVHDIIHHLRDMVDPPFQFDVHAYIVKNPDNTLASSPQEFLGTGHELQGTRRNNIEYALKLPTLLKNLHKSKPDVIHMTGFHPILVPPVMAASRNSPLVLGPNIGGWYPNRLDSVWGSGQMDLLKFKSKFRLRQILIKFLNWSRVLAFGDYHREMLHMLGIQDGDISNLHPGVDSIFTKLDSPGRNVSTPELLYVGDFSNHKGYDIFLRAISLIESNVEARVIGMGDPDWNLIRSLGLENRINVEGFISRSDLPNYYQSADLVVIPSIDETAGPNTQIEALACGTPVVATNTPGIREFAHDDATILFWPRQPRALAEAIEKALENVSVLSRSAWNDAEEYNVSNTVRQLEEIYTEVS